MYSNTILLLRLVFCTNINDKSDKKNNYKGLTKKVFRNEIYDYKSSLVNNSSKDVKLTTKNYYNSDGTPERFSKYNIIRSKSCDKKVKDVKPTYEYKMNDMLRNNDKNIYNQTNSSHTTKITDMNNLISNNDNKSKLVNINKNIENRSEDFLCNNRDNFSIVDSNSEKICKNTFLTKNDQEVFNIHNNNYDCEVNRFEELNDPKGCEFKNCNNVYLSNSSNFIDRSYYNDEIKILDNSDVVNTFIDSDCTLDLSDRDLLDLKSVFDDIKYSEIQKKNYLVLNENNPYFGNNEINLDVPESSNDANTTEGQNNIVLLNSQKPIVNLAGTENYECNNKEIHKDHTKNTTNEHIFNSFLYLNNNNNKLNYTNVKSSGVISSTGSVNNNKRSNIFDSPNWMNQNYFKGENDEFFLKNDNFNIESCQNNIDSLKDNFFCNSVYNPDNIINNPHKIVFTGVFAESTEIDKQNNTCRTILKKNSNLPSDNINHQTIYPISSSLIMKNNTNNRNRFNRTTLLNENISNHLAHHEYWGSLGKTTAITELSNVDNVIDHKNYSKDYLNSNNKYIAHQKEISYSPKEVNNSNKSNPRFSTHFNSEVNTFNNNFQNEFNETNNIKVLSTESSIKTTNIPEIADFRVNLTDEENLNFLNNSNLINNYTDGSHSDQNIKNMSPVENHENEINISKNFSSTNNKNDSENGSNTNYMPYGKNSYFLNMEGIENNLYSPQHSKYTNIERINNNSSSLEKNNGLINENFTKKSIVENYTNCTGKYPEYIDNSLNSKYFDNTDCYNLFHNPCNSNFVNNEIKTNLFLYNNNGNVVEEDYKEKNESLHTCDIIKKDTKNVKKSRKFFIENKKNGNKQMINKKNDYKNSQRMQNIRKHLQKAKNDSQEKTIYILKEGKKDILLNKFINENSYVQDVKNHTDFNSIDILDPDAGKNIRCDKTINGEKSGNNKHINIGDFSINDITIFFKPIGKILNPDVNKNTLSSQEKGRYNKFDENHTNESDKNFQIEHSFDTKKKIDDFITVIKNILKDFDDEDIGISNLQNSFESYESKTSESCKNNVCELRKEDIGNLHKKDSSELSDKNTYKSSKTNKDQMCVDKVGIDETSVNKQYKENTFKIHEKEIHYSTEKGMNDIFVGDLNNFYYENTFENEYNNRISQDNYDKVKYLNKIPESSIKKTSLYSYVLFDIDDRKRIIKLLSEIKAHPSLIKLLPEFIIFNEEKWEGDYLKEKQIEIFFSQKIELRLKTWIQQMKKILISNFEMPIGFSYADYMLFLELQYYLRIFIIKGLKFYLDDEFYKCYLNLVDKYYNHTLQYLKKSESRQSKKNFMLNKSRIKLSSLLRTLFYYKKIHVDSKFKQKRGNSWKIHFEILLNEIIKNEVESIAYITAQSRYFGIIFLEIMNGYMSDKNLGKIYPDLITNQNNRKILKIVRLYTQYFKPNFLKVENYWRQKYTSESIKFTEYTIQRNVMTSMNFVNYLERFLDLIYYMEVLDFQELCFYKNY